MLDLLGAGVSVVNFRVDCLKAGRAARVGAASAVLRKDALNAANDIVDDEQTLADGDADSDKDSRVRGGCRRRRLRTHPDILSRLLADQPEQKLYQAST